MNSNKILSKFQGSILGLAIGDALGAPVEFEARGSFEVVTKMRAGGPFNLKKGQWTDDTSLALCIAQSLIENKNFIAADVMKRFHAWYREGYMSCTGHCFDIGNTTKASIMRYETHGEFFGGRSEDTPANGSLMRLAPIPLYFHQNLSDTLKFSEESSRITHASQISIDACKALALLIHRALLDYSKDEILEYKKNDLNLVPEIAEVLMGSYREKTRDEIKATGLARDCLEAALWAFYHSENFNDGVISAVNLGEDSDTVGAVFGQLAGAFYGLENISSDFLSDLWDGELLKDVATKLYAK